jgi:chemotaxis-related protein WspD
VNRTDSQPPAPARAGAPATPPLAFGQPVEVYACWNEIGVHGSGTCAELQKFIRCENCPVYASAGARLLDRTSPPEYRREQKEYIARRKQLPAQRRHSAVIFRLNVEWFALPTEAFQEVSERRPVHSLPHRRRGMVVGLVNTRGELLVCVSLGHLLGLANVPPIETLRTLHQRLLVADWGGSRIVFPVDEVCGIHRFDMQQLQEPPATLAKSNQTFTRGILHWEGRTVGFLDPNALFSALDRSLA